MTVVIKTDFQGIYRLVARVTRGYSTESASSWARSEAHNIARSFFSQNFSTEGKRLGKKWQPLSSRTQADRRRAGYGPTGPMLVRRGSLKNIVLVSKPNIRSNVDNVTTTWGEINDVKYLANQTGSSKNLPARPMIAANKGDMDTLTKSLRAHIRRRMM